MELTGNKITLKKCLGFVRAETKQNRKTKWYEKKGKCANI
jgi:hypothetical protein